MTIDGKIQMAAAAPGDEQPDPDALEALLVRGFQADARAGHVRAVGWFYTVDVSELPGGETSALKLCVEHADGEVAVVYVPFRRRRDGAAEYGELVRVAAQGRVFTPARS
jgi:hypothetical protein